MVERMVRQHQGNPLYAVGGYVGVLDGITPESNDTLSDLEGRLSLLSLLLELYSVTLGLNTDPRTVYEFRKMALLSIFNLFTFSIYF